MTDNNHSLSSVLEGAMRNSGISLEKISQETGISERFIRLLLEEDFDKLPATPYLHGYIVKISDYLNLDGEELWKIYFKNSESLKKSGSRDKLPENRFYVPSINKKIIIIFLILLLVPLYFIFRSTFSGNISNNLSLANLEENITMTTTSNFTITGELEGDLSLKLNNSQVLLNEDGSFKTEIELEPGFNTLNFIIEGPLNREATVTKQVFFELEETEEETAEENIINEEEQNDLILPSPEDDINEGNIRAPLF
ncbi:MAG: helix-turn-helix transcriptional regulator [Candidatus Paceibacterota bacterium]